MNEEEFRQRAHELGYRDIQFKDYAPNLDGPLHVHEFSVMLLVVSGEFSLALQEGTTTYPAGGYCELTAEVAHAERTGALGAKVLLGKKQAVAPWGPHRPTEPPRSRSTTR